MGMQFHPCRISLSRSAAVTLIIMVCVAFESGCAFSPHKTYDGPGRPASEIVTLYPSSQFAFWSQISIHSVDGQRFAGNVGAISVLPGTHWYQVIDSRRSKLAMLFLHDYFYTEAMCGFMLEAMPGTVYSLLNIESGGLVATNERKVYRASIEIEERFAERDPIVRHIPIECASWDLLPHGWHVLFSEPLALGFLCQDNAHCLAEGAACIKEAGYSYGICAKP
jgi:hypothetical protein